MNVLEIYRFDLLEVDGKKCKPEKFARMWAYGPVDAIDGMLRDMPKEARGKMVLGLVKERIIAAGAASFWEAYVHVGVTRRRVRVSVDLEWIRDGDKLVRV